MSKYIDIEAKLKIIEGGLFQRLCDELLLRMGYKNIHSLGAQSGTNKTTSGTPDTYFKNEKGKYIFVEYTVQQDNIYKKIKDDLNKCFDSAKTGIAIQDIVEIVYCHVSSNLTPKDDKKLHEFCLEKNVKLTIYGIDEIADKLNRHYKSLAKEYLGISIDTNQIFTIDEYIKWYDSNKMMVPLSTTFQFRDKEMKEMIDCLKMNKVILVKGKAGVGKTRLALEVVRKFGKTNDYKVYCIKSFDIQIREDVASVIDSPGNYLFLIDDANELIGLKFVLNYLNMLEEGYNIKIVATVRDYTAEKVCNQIKEYVDPVVFNIKSFADEQIKEFLLMNFQLENEIVTNRILKICEGNARIAYMAGKIINEKENLMTINDSTELYEKYYSKYINDSIFSENIQLLRVAGLLSTVNTINLSNTDYLKPFFDLIMITQVEFQDLLFRLCELEYVEIKLDQVVTISDQCLRNYLLYYCFCEKKVIVLSNFIELGFKKFKNNTENLIGILWNIFGSEKNKAFVINELNEVWNKYEKIGGELFLSFIKSFGTIRPEETLIKIKEIIDKSENKIVDINQINFSTNSYRISNDVLELIDQFSFSNYVPETIELLCDYAKKRQDLLTDIYERIRDDFSFNLESSNFNYIIQNEVMDTLVSKRSSNIITKLYLELANHFLRFEYKTQGNSRGDKFTIYTFWLVNNSGSSSLRNNIWNELIKISDECLWKKELFNILNQYSSYIDDKADIELLKKDKYYVVKLINRLEKDLELSRICARIKGKWLKYGVDYNEEFKFLFDTELWKIYKLFGEDDFHGSDFRVKEENRKKEIVHFAKSYNFEKIHELIIYLNDFSKINDRTSYIVAKCFEWFINEIVEDYLKLKIVLFECMEVGQDITFHPNNAIKTLISGIGAKDTYSIIMSKSYSQQNYWQYTFFDLLDLENINDYFADECLNFLRNDNDRLIKQSSYRELDFLDKFKTINSDIFFEGCEIIYDKYQYSKFIVSIYFEFFFNDYITKPSELYRKFEKHELLLRKIYFLLIEYSYHTDYNGKFLNYFISKDAVWLEEYVSYLYKSINNSAHLCERLGYSWNQGNYIEIYDFVFDHFEKPSNDYCYATESKLKHLFIHRDGYEEMVTRQDEWIIHAVSRYAFDDKIFPLFRIISNLDTELRKKALIKFIEINDEYATFERLQIVSTPDIMYSSEKPYLETELKFCESLLDCLTGVNYLRHRAFIQRIIISLNKRMRDEEISIMLRKSYF